MTTANTSQLDRIRGKIDWPTHLGRTPPRERKRTSKFSVTFHQAIDAIAAELEDRIGVDDWRLSTTAPHRKDDGLPYANASPDDPSVVVRWSMDGNQYAVACDHYTDWRDNARAIGLYIAEKRKMQDRPVTTGQSEFATAELPPADEDAVAAPPAPSSNEPDRAPHEVLGVSPDASDTVVKGAARALLKADHPDLNGDGDDLQTIKWARDAMLQEGDA